MRIFPDCFPCFSRQTIIALNHAGIPETDQIRILQDIAEVVHATGLRETPAHLTTFLHRRIRALVGRDPFREIKREYNEKAMRLYPSLEKMVKEFDDPLLTAARLAIAGNIIDFGIFTSVDMEGTVERALSGSIAIDDYQSFRKEIGKVKQVLYLLDNAGEIVFDKLFIETLLKEGVDVTAVVKGSAVINDALIEDARQIGLDKVCRIIDNGSDAVGTILQWCSDEFSREFSQADLIISKGQGNFETLHAQRDKNIYFLFQVKCDVVARFLGLEKGAMIFSRGDI